jgi:N-formylglutamate deformylase
MPLPILVSIPHGGDQIPPEIADAFALTRYEWWVEDADAETRAIYDVGGLVECVIAADVARAVVDMSRPTDQHPPEFPDGATKSHTCYGRPVWHPGSEPNAEARAGLLARYHAPYHEALAAAERDHPVVVGLDCHSMAAVGPAISPDPGRPRPAFCIGNRHGESAPDSLALALRDALIAAFGVEPGEVTLNEPFAGGHITRSRGSSPIPWLQVEMSRALYLAPPWLDESTCTVDAARLAELNAGWRRALAQFAGSLPPTRS